MWRGVGGGAGWVGAGGEGAMKLMVEILRLD